MRIERTSFGISTALLELRGYRPSNKNRCLRRGWPKRAHENFTRQACRMIVSVRPRVSGKSSCRIIFHEAPGSCNCAWPCTCRADACQLPLSHEAPGARNCISRDRRMRCEKDLVLRDPPKLLQLREPTAFSLPTCARDRAASTTHRE